MRSSLSAARSALLVAFFCLLILVPAILIENPLFVDAATPILLGAAALAIYLFVTGLILSALHRRFSASARHNPATETTLCTASALFLTAAVVAACRIPLPGILFLAVVVLAILSFIMVPAFVLRHRLPRWLRYAGLVALCLLWIPALLNVRASRQAARVSTIFFGVDGATWKIIDPLMEQGSMPTLASLCREGSYGRLRSVSPTLSPILWTTIATGKNPRKHGVQNFFDTARSVRTTRLWDIAEEKIGPVGVFAYPVTWPPREVESGFMFPSHFARGDDTWPPELRFLKELGSLRREGRRPVIGILLQDLITGVRRGLRAGTLYRSARVLLDDSLGRIDERERDYLDRIMKLYWYRDVYIALLKRYEPAFTVFYMNQPDAISHVYWKYFEPQGFPDLQPGEVERYGKFVPNAYIEVDRVIGEILDAISDSATVVVVSDHGFKSISEPGKGIAYRIHEQNLVETLGLQEEISGVNITNTTILQCEDLDPDRFERLVETLEAATLEESGEPVFDVEADTLGSVFVRVRYYVGSREEDHLRIGDRVVPYLDIVAEKEAYRFSGIHELDGIFLLRGPGIRAGYHFERRATILDVTPTVLATMGLPIGRDMDGRVLTFLFDKDSHETISFVESYDSDADSVGQTVIELGEDEIPKDLKKRLKALGYVN